MLFLRLRRQRASLRWAADITRANSTHTEPPEVDTRSRRGDSESYALLGVSRDSWFHGLHAPPALDAALPADSDLYGTLAEKHVRLTPRALTALYADARERTMRVLGHLTEEQLLGHEEASLNPSIWGVGHIGHFYEAMVLRVLCPGEELHPAGTLLHNHDVDGMFDSFRADHGDRWGGTDGRGLSEVSPEGEYPAFKALVDGYYGRMQELCVRQLWSAAECKGANTCTDVLLDPATTYLHMYGVIHEHWHIEDFYQTLQTMAYPAPASFLPGAPHPFPAPGFGRPAVHDMKVSSDNEGVASADGCDRDEEGPCTQAVLLPANAWGGVFVLDEAEVAAPCRSQGAQLPGDVRIGAGVYELGVDARTAPWCFDAEKAPHRVNIRPFRIAKAPVTNLEYAKFVADDGYRRRELWCHEGWRWLTRGQASTNVSHHETDSGVGRNAPRYWVPDESGVAADGSDDALPFVTRRFDEDNAPLNPHEPVVHVSWFEAQAFCAWAGRRLPTEAEWEVAACCEPTSLAAGAGEWHHWDAPSAGASMRPPVKRLYPWGDEPPTPGRCNIDALRGRLLPVDALPAGDSAFGCRQMIGNVWEWTGTAFFPFPGFVPDFPYRENSCPWFGYRKVLKGGCWATSAPIVRNSYRNSFWPNMDAVFTGFRTAEDDDQ